MTVLLQVEDLRKHFPVSQGVLLSKLGKTVKAVDGVSFTVDEGETLGLVGESGCGKSTAGRAILRLIPPTAGEVWFQGENVLALPPREERRQGSDDVAGKQKKCCTSQEEQSLRHSQASCETTSVFREKQV